MLVKNIIKKVAKLINNADIASAIDNNSFSDAQQKEITLLVDCVNLTNANIATNYVKLYDVKNINNTNGVVNFSKITSDAIFDIVSVKHGGKDVAFSITSSGVLTKKGELTIKYTYFPKDLGYEDSVENYPTKICERNFVYGVISEYLFAKGVFDEALVWEERFKNEMKTATRPQKTILIKKGRWA